MIAPPDRGEDRRRDAGGDSGGNADREAPTANGKPSVPPPIRSMIVDDEPAARRGIEQLLEQRPDFEIAGECSDGESLLETIADVNPDLLFLDVQMPGLDGFDALASVTRARLPHVIFVTAYDRYAVRAFEAHAIDFLLKPYDAERFHEACDRARDVIRAREADAYHARLVTMVRDLTERLDEKGVTTRRQESGAGRFVVRSHGSISFVNVSDVLWIGAARDYVRLHTAEHSHLIRETMTALEEQLASQGFVRIHRSTLVHIDAIRQIRTRTNGRCAVVLPDGTERVVSRAGKGMLEEALGVSL
ncbi:MAG: LytTR family DNA-binding domain-containing protein [Gemmatimonadota bacterium]|nr:LytTR family DNA-binding domain-containing protein [Gemmatimonadota bacterium]